MGCASSQPNGVRPLTEEDIGPVNISARSSQGLAFEVPLHDSPPDDDSQSQSLIKKHPPKRLQRLEEQPVSPPTLQELEEKLAEAEQRRLQILSQRVASARARQKMKGTVNRDSKSNGLMIEHLQYEPTTVEL